eukprot:1999776-Amphidinium_carterae.1
MVALTQSIQNQLQRLLPKSTTRTNVFTKDGGGVRGMLLLANLARGWGITRNTRHETQLLHDILHLARHAPVPISFASIQVNMYLKAVRMPWHYDLKNC